MASIRALIITPKHPNGFKVNRLLSLLLDRFGAEEIRLNEFTFGTSWVDPIMEAIRKADIIFFDISTLNGNVFYELGIAHALNKATILFRERSSTDPVPSDLQGFIYWTYDMRYADDEFSVIVEKAIGEVKKQRGGNDE